MQFPVAMSHALATARFKPEDSDSTELSNLMENLDSFLSDEKGRAEQRIKTCESFLNNPGLTSASLKDGKFYQYSGYKNRQLTICSVEVLG